MDHINKILYIYGFCQPLINRNFKNVGMKKNKGIKLSFSICLKLQKRKNNIFKELEVIKIQKYYKQKVKWKKIIRFPML